MNSKSESQRLFFALWPDESLRHAIRTQLNRWRLKEGRRVKPENLHITLAFLGDVPRQRIDCICRGASRVSVPRFELRLDRHGHFRRSGVLWLGSGQWPEAIFALQQGLNGVATACGLTSDRKPFHPHMTLVRKLYHLPRLAPVEPLTWPVARFALVTSETRPEGAEYQILSEWELA